jgi:DNA-directed RNA polymerase subunit RPC12/RpoP
MVKIECLACGKNVKIPPYINTKKYDGEVVCQECKALLHVKLVKDKVEKYKIVERIRPGAPLVFRVIQDDDKLGSGQNPP